MTRSSALAGALIACAPSSSESNNPPPAKAEADVKPQGPSDAVLAKICASPCAGEFARIAVFRTAAGKIGALRFDGDLQQCSHPPRVYFDADGGEIVTIPERPVERGSEEAKRFAAQQEAAAAGMTEAESVRCP